MGMNLVIVESPAKAKTINKILGAEYVVKASMGHVRDLPEKSLGVDVEKHFRPQYVTIKSRAKVLKELQAAAKDADKVFLAPDPDREGEAIAWHLREALDKQVAADRFFRVSYNEITASAIRKAFANPGHINQPRVDSQQARRVLDRLVGYKVSPLLWRRIRGASSAGRVQSVALRLVCERERAIENFKPEEYWLIGALAAKLVDPRDPFEIRLARVGGEKAEIGSAERAQAIRADLEGRGLKVTAIVPREIFKRAMPPFITSTLQQAASSVLGLPPAATMRIAQKLYEGMDFGQGPVGLITYMRTDSFSVSQDAQTACRDYIRQAFGPDYLPESPNIYRSRSSAQEAHEAIRPTDLMRTPDEMGSRLAADEHRLYRLIWQRFVASQMAPARIAQRTAEIEAPPPAGKTSTYLFRATASEVVFPGYMKVLGIEEKKKDENGEEVDRLPPLQPGEDLECREWLSQQKFTQPPPRFSEAALVKALEENGVGRPSTYAQILSTLQARKYVEKEKRSLKPTPLGLNVNDFLVTHLDELFDIKFTASMEALLDEIENGTIEWSGMLAEFYGKFLVWLQKARGPDANPESVKCLMALAAAVKEWGPETKRGRRVYGDGKFVDSLRKQFDEGQKPISERQVEALKRVVYRYRDQIPAFAGEAEKLGITEASMKGENGLMEPPSPETLRKLEALKSVTFDPARQVGKRSFDDRVFCQSLRDQAERGKRLSENQISYLDRMLMKYSDQMADFEAFAKEVGLGVGGGTDLESGPLLDLLRQVRDWKPPFQRGRREWDDHKFFESLSRQFAERKQLSPKQRESLKKMLRRYAAQVPGYAEAAARFGIPAREKETSAKA